MKEFVLNNWYYLLYCSILFIYGIIIFVKFIKAKAQAKTNKEIAEAKEELKLNINKLIQEAEKLTHYKGNEKKEFVMTRAIQLSNGLMSNEQIDEYIEEQVKLTDTVNKHNR